MSQNVAQLKALLFDGEARAIADLARRIDALAEGEKQARAELSSQLRQLASAADRENRQIAETRIRELRQLAEAQAAEVRQLQTQSAEVRARAEADAVRAKQIGDRLDAVFERAGTTERLERNVALVIDGALRQAEVERHHDVSDAIAPLVVRTIKAEIRNSQEDLVQALYPMTGRMVKAYVASAMRDLIEDINRRLESNWLMLRLKSLQTGRSVAELALAETQRLHVDELYLIRRGSGELIGRWPDTPATANRDQVLSGILTAINDFASEAFKGEGSALRQIDLEDSQVYLRASPAYLLAVRCTGTAHAAVERVIDDEFLSAIEHHSEALSAHPSSAMTAGTHTALLSELSSHLSSRIAEKQADLVRPAFGFSPAKVLAAIILLPFTGWLAWTGIESFKTSRVRSVAQRVIETSTEVKGYPLAVDVEPWGRALTITGLTPTDAAREDVVKRLTDLLPNTQVRDQLSVVPSAGDARPQLALVRGELARLQADTVRASLRRTVDRTRLRLQQAVTDLAALRASAADAAAAKVVERAEGTATQTIAELRALQQKLGALQGRHADLAPVKDQLAELSRSLTVANGDIAGIIGNREKLSRAVALATNATAADAAEELNAQSERLAALTIAVYHANLLNGRPMPPIAAPTPRERVEAWARANAVFFGNGTEYRNPQRASTSLDALAALLKEARLLVRVVGFTDEQGTATQNSQLSISRAERVVADLVGRGVPAAKLVAIGRGQGNDVSPVKGPQSPNRRVEIQVGFEGEEFE